MSKYRQILTKYWGYSDFRPMQEDIIISVDEHKKDTLGLLPTGGGKSVIFQVPALTSDGLCLVVTPLIALMKDQVENLKKRGIQAAAIYSGMTSHEIDITLNNAVHGAYKFLYLSPERLSTTIFLARLPDMKINLIAIDEAHCISQWGYDFRPSYLKIADIRAHLPDTKILALTATATPEVAEDIQVKLGFKEKNLFRKSFERKNLVYIVREVEDKFKYLLRIVNTEKGTGVVYVRNRKKTVEIAQFLRDNGVSADYYHAGVEPKLKDMKQEQWKNDKIRIIVSTNAFGMGIDKSDVRFVVHLDLPDSPEAYFQEAGRGGRDEKTAYAVLLYNKSDKLSVQKRIETSFPEREFIKEIYHSICNYYEIPQGEGKGLVRPLRVRDFSQKFGYQIQKVHSSLKFLQSEGYLDLTEDAFTPAKVFFNITRDDLYKFQVSKSQYDVFIKLLLRTYTGMFSGYVSIDEEQLAKQAGTSTETIIEYLKYLSAEGVIKYVAPQQTPFIIFTEERLDDKNLRISKTLYDEKKERFLKRMEAMVHYAESTAKCRSQILLAYFGETDTARCGHCDVCKRRNELHLSKFEFDRICEQIKELLNEQPHSIEKLTDNIDSNPEQIITVVRWMLDNQKIEYNSEKKLVRTKKSEKKDDK